MNFKLFLLSAATMVNAAYGTTPVPVPFSLGTAGDFVILAKAGITNGCLAHRWNFHDWL
jgi:hypothetical protein